jgi:hypothetical protein
MDPSKLDEMSEDELLEFAQQLYDENVELKRQKENERKKKEARMRERRKKHEWIFYDYSRRKKRYPRTNQRITALRHHR